MGLPLQRLLVVLTLAGIIILSVLPADINAHIRTSLPGSVEHFIAYAVAACVLGYLYRSPGHRILTLVTLTVFALVLELVQWPLPGRDSSVLDFMASAAGAWTGTGIVLVVEHLIAAGRRRSAT
jgi:VanZ family protein